MSPKRLAARLVAGATLLTSGPRAVAAGAEPSTRLFCIERSKNANVACYDLRQEPNGTINSRSPLDAYWIMRAEDGRRERFTWLERQWAYGYRVIGKPRATEIQFQLVAFPQRVFVVKHHGNTFRAEVLVAGRPSLLRNLYVRSVEGALLPKVLFVELWGIDVATGHLNHERLEN